MATRSFLSNPFRKPDAQVRLQMEQEIEDELMFHLEMRQSDNEANGMSLEDAKQDAWNRFGDVDAIRRKCLTEKVESPFLKAWYSVQMTGGLSVAIAALCLVFIVFNATQYRLPLTYHNEDNWSSIWWQFEDSTFSSSSSVSDYLAFRDQTASFSALTAARYAFHYIGSQTGAPQRVRVKHVSPNYFDLHGVGLVIGEEFNAADYESPSLSPVILSYRLWEKRFNKDRELVGKTLLLDGQEVLIKGVAPSSFRMYYETDIFVPLLLDSIKNKNSTILLLGGQRKPGISEREAQAELRNLTQSIPQKEVILRTVKDVYGSAVIKPLSAYLIGTFLILILVCVHLIRKQIYMPFESLGKQSLAFSLPGLLKSNMPAILVAVIIGFAGSAVAVEYALPYLIGEFDHLYDVRIDATVILFGLSLVVVLALLLCLLPWGLVKLKSFFSRSSYKENKKATQRLRPIRKVYGFSSAFEIAFACAISIIACLILNQFWLHYQQQPGYSSDDVLAIELTMPYHRMDTSQERVDFMQRVFQKIDSIPSIQQASLSSSLPDEALDMNVLFSYTQDDYAKKYTIVGNRVGIDYLQIIDVPLMLGRYFNLDDLNAPLGSVIVNQAFADAYWPATYPIGQTAYLGRGKHPVEVVGVVGNVAPQHEDPGYTQPTMYFLFWGATSSDVQLLVKTEFPPRQVVADVKQAIWAVDTEIPVQQASWLPDIEGQRTKKYEMFLVLFSFLALGGVLFALYSVEVSTRQSIEWYIHDLGHGKEASQPPRHVWFYVFKDQIAPILLGVLLGLAGSQLFMQSPLLHALDVRQTDLISFLPLAVLLLFTLLLSALVFSRKARAVNQHLAVRFG